MANLRGFTCNEWLYTKYDYWNWTIIVWKTTTMLPKHTTTVGDLLEILKNEKWDKNSQISICQNWNNSDFIKVNNSDKLIQHSLKKITWILCIESKKWTYYDVVVDQWEMKYEEPKKNFDKIESTKSILTNFNFKKYKNPGNMELLDGDIDSGDEYHIEPKTTVTVQDLINLINKIWDKNILISVDSAELEETTNYIKTSEIPDKFKNLKIEGWSILFGKKGTYYAVSTWFNPNETKDPE